MFGWMVSHIVKGDQKFGFLDEPIKFLYSFPDSFKQSVEEVKSLPKTFIKTPKDFETVNLLENDLLSLVTFADTGNYRTVALMNLKNDSIYHTWSIENKYGEASRIKNPLMMPDSSLIYGFTNQTGVFRITSDGKRLWNQNSIFQHHSMNFDSDSNIWVCSMRPVYYATCTYKLDKHPVFYRDNSISKIDPETGEILFNKSFTDILLENGLEYYLTKSQNAKDPIHLNDVEPALKTTQYFNKGDVFISARNLSLIMQYRPSTNEIIRIIEGPFASQHDVDIYNDHSLVFFNNNYYNIWTLETLKPPIDSTHLIDVGYMCSVITKYDFETEKFSVLEKDVFEDNHIFTPTEGLQEFINDSTVFVEEQNSGLLWVIQGDKVIYKSVLKSQHEGYHHLPNWTRILKY